MFQKIPSKEKIMDNEGGFTFFRRIFFASHRRETSWVNPSVFQKCYGIKMFCVVGVSRFCRSFLSHITEKIRGGPLFFVKVLLLKNFWIIRYHYFVEFLCLTSPEIIVGETLCVAEILWYQIFWDNRGITNLSIVFVSWCRNFCGVAFNGSKKLGHPKFLCIIGEFHDFRSKNFSLTRPKKIVGERFVVSKLLGYRKLLCKRVEGSITIVRLFTFCLNS